MDPAITLLRDLVAIDSVNPSLVPGAKGEGAAAQAVAAHMQRLGLEVHVQQVAPVPSARTFPRWAIGGFALAGVLIVSGLAGFVFTRTRP